MFVTFSVPMMYPYSIVEQRFGEFAKFYLFNPLAEAVLLFQRCFWVGTTEQSQGHDRDQHARPPVRGRGAHVTAGLVALVIAQLVFARFESKIPERL